MSLDQNNPLNLPSLPGQGPTRFDGLDILRTLLAMLVALGHFFHWNGVTDRVPSTFFLAVDFFFALSGFVLTQSIVSDTSRDAREFLRRFVMRRLFRLFPLYLLVFILWVPLLLAHLPHDPFYEYLISFLMIHALGFANPDAHIFADTSIGIGWSISVEFWAGLLFFLAVYVLRHRPALLWAFCVFVALLGLLLMVNFSPNYMNVNLQKFKGIATFGEIRGFIGFALGCLAYFVYARIASIPNRGAILYSAAELAVLAVIVILYVHVGAYARDNEFAAPFLAMISITLIALRRGVFSRLLYMRWISPLRPLSYSIYLIHPFFIFAFRHLSIGFDSGKHAVIYEILVILSAAALYETIEKKGIALGKRFGKSATRMAFDPVAHL